MKNWLRLLLAGGLLMVGAQTALAAGSFSDTFDHFNDAGWVAPPAPFNALTLGNFEDASSSNCYRGGCVRMDAGIGGLGGGGHSPVMYLETGVGSNTGAFTIWAKAGASAYHVPSNIGLCSPPSTNCQQSIYFFSDFAPTDGIWHQYYVSWRQGSTTVETCILQDDIDGTHCAWKNTNLSLGTEFSAIELNNGGLQRDANDHLWYDELQDASVATSVPACTIECNDNVMFLPGLEGSRLYRPDAGGEKRLWQPDSDADASQLAMNSDGTSVNSDIYTRDIIDNAYVPEFGNVYKSFIDSMNGLVSSGKIAEWEPIPYDWRYSPEAILASGKKIDAAGNISYSVATSSSYIIQELKRLASTSRTGKVTIVAHSGGGLVAKALMIALGADAAKYVDKIILVDVPQVGTPVALASLLHGSQQGFPIEPFPYALTPQTARSVGDTMPGVYTLLPSANYFTYVDDPVATFDSATMPDWASAYGDVVHSQTRQHAFLADTPHMRTAPNAQNLKEPTILSDALLTQAEQMHQTLDAWTPPTGVKIIQIAGWGIPTTIKGINYSRSTLTNSLGTFTSTEPSPQFTVDGDGTVVTPSQLWMSTTTGAEDYWVDLEKYNKKFIINQVFGVDPISHASILEVDQVRELLADIIENNPKPISNYDDLFSNSPASTASRLRYSLHSPLALNFYDDQGHHTGISTSTGQIEEQIPGTYYTEFGDVKYIFTNTNVPVHVVMNGYATSTFTFNVEQLQVDTVTASTTWQNMPVTPKTTVTIDTPSDINSLSPMRIDLNSDGSPDYTLAPVSNGIVTLPKYVFSGFLQPINDTGHQKDPNASIFKAGSTIPVKFQLKKTDGTIIQAATPPIWLSPVRGSGAVNNLAATSAGATYKWDNGQYIYNWNTKGLAAGYWYTIYAKLDDGKIYSIRIGLR